jgi:acetyltransferase
MPRYRAPSSRRFHPERLFHPGSLAIIGSETREGARILANIDAAGFKGAILQFTGPSDLAALSAAPDLAVVATEPDDVAGALMALGQIGCTAAVVASPAPHLAAIARSSGVRVLGPDSFGIAVPAIGLNATRSHLPIPGGNAALVSQSAALCRAVLDWAGPNGLGFSHIVGIGGNADIGFGMALEWLARDPGTGAILLDIHSIKDRRVFLSAARAAARLRPVLAIRPGARLDDPSGDAEATFAAALGRAGVIAVATLEQLLAAAETLTRARPARGEALAILTNAAGAGQIAADAALRSGVPLAEIPPEARHALQVALPSECLDVSAGPVCIGLENPTRLAEAGSMLAALPEIGGILIVLAPEGASDSVAIEAIVACTRAAKVPILVCVLGETTGAAHRVRLAAAGVAVFSGSEQAVRGFLRLVQQRRNRAAARELPPSNVLQIEPDRELVRCLFAAARNARTVIPDHEAGFRVLAAYGLHPVPMRPAATTDEAARAATELGFPVVLKLRRSSRVVAQSPPTPLMLGLANEQAVRGAARMLAERSPDAAARGFLVQRQLERARELMIRVADDVMFGPTIRFGQGGSAAELLHDLAFDLPPLNLPLARALVARPRIARTFGELRDHAAANTEAIAEALVRISQLVVDFPEIAELEINPLFADGDAALVGNCALVLRPHGEVGRLAISPYPAELCEVWERGGERLIVRPIRPEDAEAHRAFFQRLPPEDIRYRFFSPLRELSAEQTARMTQIDYDREMAFIANRASDLATVAVARLAREDDPATAEFAVIVQPDMKGSGVATHLMLRLIDWARSRGISEIFGQVLADNAPMLAFARRMGFAVRHLTGEDDVLEVRLPLR